jgi:amino acid transporter
MLASGERPRELKWYHAGPMLFGDWGTSRLYVLGLAYAFTGHASFWYIVAMCALMTGVGWSYEIICRLFPDGGGVYSSARHRSQILAVIGGLLLCADYVVTAAMSCLDGFHYLGFQSVRLLGVLPLDATLTALMILGIGALNFFGPTKTGTVAMFVALATVVLTMIIAIYCIPHLGAMRVENPLDRGLRQSWVGFTELILALSGVEAIANMTGIMVPPVEKTARKAIVPVLIEIVILNLILGAAMNTLPSAILDQQITLADGSTGLAHTSDMLKVIAEFYVGPTFAAASSIVFAVLLFSAVNTALADLVSIQFMLSRDRELPHAFGLLNRFGMPMLPLLVGTVVPALVVLLFPNVERLAGLYAIGVVGAISINLGTTSTNPELPLKRHERVFMFGLTLIMIAVGVTICIVKPHARSFAILVLVVGLAARLATIVSNKAVPISRGARNGYLALAAVSVLGVLALSLVTESKSVLPSLGEAKGGVAFGLSAALVGAVGFASYRTQGYREALIAAAHAAAPAEVPAKPKMIQEGAYKPKSRIMVATQGNPRLIDFALQECQSRQAELQLLFIRHLAFNPIGPIEVTKLDEDEQAQELFDRVREQAREAGVPLRLLYGVARDIPDAILDMAVTHGADMLLLGSTRRGALWKAMKGDVIQAVAEQLPEAVGLLIHA